MTDVVTVGLYCKWCDTWFGALQDIAQNINNSELRELVDMALRAVDSLMHNLAAVKCEIQQLSS